MAPEKLKDRLEKCRVASNVLPVIHRLLLSSPTCEIHDWFKVVENPTLDSLHQVAPRGVALGLFDYALKKGLEVLDKKDVLLGFATSHVGSTWEWIESGFYQNFGIETPKLEDKSTLLFIHILNPGQVVGNNEVLTVGERVRLKNLFCPTEINIKKGDFILTHCGWVIEKIDSGLAEEIRKAQKKIQMNSKSLFQTYSQLPSQIDFQTIFGGFFSGRHR